jgi:hypothetical protein
MNRKGMPAELLNELFGSLSLENAFVLLAKMPNGLLARNVLKMINGIKMVEYFNKNLKNNEFQAMKNNKLNKDDCGPKLEIFEDGHLVKHSGPHDSKIKENFNY